VRNVEVVRRVKREKREKNGKRVKNGKREERRDSGPGGIPGLQAGVTDLLFLYFPFFLNLLAP
jgi:hypothetical protein